MQNNKTHYQLGPWRYCTVYIRVALAVPCTSMMSIFVQDLWVQGWNEIALAIREVPCSGRRQPKDANATCEWRSFRTPMPRSWILATPQKPCISWRKQANGTFRGWLLYWDGIDGISKNRTLIRKDARESQCCIHKVQVRRIHDSTYLKQFWAALNTQKSRGENWVL